MSYENLTESDDGKKKKKKKKKIGGGEWTVNKYDYQRKFIEDKGKGAVPWTIEIHFYLG